MDSGGGVQIAGTLSSDTDADFWTFDAIDVDEVTTNSYHVSINLVIEEGSEDIVFDVIRGDLCADVPTGPGTNITAYTWCVDGKGAGGLTGESPCAADGPVHCNNHTSKYYVRVHRKDGAAPACTPYKIDVAAKSNGAACDFMGTCQ
jgi:hypothetical protein